MTISILLRLRATLQLNGAAGDNATDLAGQAEVVATGETALFRDGQEMLAFVRKVTDESASAEATRTDHHRQGDADTDT